MIKIDIQSQTLLELEKSLQGMGEPSFRAKQVFDWLHNKRVTAFGQMTNLPQALIHQLEVKCELTTISLRKKQLSKRDGTQKYLFSLPDGELIETVTMPYEHGISVCISTQVGCKMGCAFCASAKAGFVRNLLPSEMLQQVYAMQREQQNRVSHVVLMGIGEPLDNYNHVVTFLQLIHHPMGANISMRNITLSTCGVVDKIDQLACLRLGLTLAVSLHAVDDEVRNRLLPVNKRWNIAKLLQSCRNYSKITNRRVSIEYALIAGVNDTPAHAQRLAKLIEHDPFHVNLILVNPVQETDFQSAGHKHASVFQIALKKRGINATVRRTMGSDIGAACGQLRRDHVQAEPHVPI